MEKSVYGSGKAWKTRGIFLSYFVVTLSNVTIFRCSLCSWVNHNQDCETEEMCGCIYCSHMQMHSQKGLNIFLRVQRRMFCASGLNNGLKTSFSPQESPAEDNPNLILLEWKCVPCQDWDVFSDRISFLSEVCCSRRQGIDCLYFTCWSNLQSCYITVWSPSVGPVGRELYTRTTENMM